jgi:hypothetical protein
MISRIKFRSGGRNYPADRVLSFDIPEYYTRVNTFFIIHDTKQVNLPEILHVYKETAKGIIYTSDPYNVYKPTRNSDNDNKLYGTSTFSEEKIGSLVDYHCIDEKYSSMFIVVNSSIQPKITETEKAFALINIETEDDIVNPTINTVKIIDTNIHDIQDKEFYVKRRFLWISKGSQIFNGYIKYRMINFTFENTIGLKYIEDLDTQYQTNALYAYTHSEHNDYEYLIRALLHASNYCKYCGNNAGSDVLRREYKKVSKEYIKSLLDNEKADELFDIFINNVNDNYFTSIKNIIMHIKNIKKMKQSIMTIPTSPLPDNIITELNDLYMSPITFDTVTEVINEKKCFGCLINCVASCNNSTKIDGVRIDHVSTTLVTNDELINGHIIYWKKYHSFDTGHNMSGVFSGNAIGKCNAILPLFINDKHWILAVKHIPESISLSMCQNSYSFSPGMIVIYYHCLYFALSIFDKNPSYKLFIIIINIYASILHLPYSPIVDLIRGDIYVYLFHTGKYHQCLEEKTRRLYSKHICVDYTNNDEINAGYKFTQSNPNAFYNSLIANRGILSFKEYEIFKNSFNNAEEYDYAKNICDLNKTLNYNEHKEIIIESMLLQASIAKKTKKRILASKHFIDASNATLDDIVNNINTIKKKYITSS